MKSVEIVQKCTKEDILEEEEEESLLNWVNSFFQEGNQGENVCQRRCNNLTDLSDGAMICAILCKISPNNFKKCEQIVLKNQYPSNDSPPLLENQSNSLQSIQNKWIQHQDVWNTVLSELESYYIEKLGCEDHLSTSFTTFIDERLIYRDCSIPELLKVLKIILPCILSSVNKEKWIANIMNLSASNQYHLMKLIQSTISRFSLNHLLNQSVVYPSEVIHSRNSIQLSQNLSKGRQSISKFSKNDITFADTYEGSNTNTSMDPFHLNVALPEKKSACQSRNDGLKDLIIVPKEQECHIKSIEEGCHILDSPYPVGRNLIKKITSPNFGNTSIRRMLYQDMRRESENKFKSMAEEIESLKLELDIIHQSHNSLKYEYETLQKENEELSKKLRHHLDCKFQVSSPNDRTGNNTIQTDTAKTNNEQIISIGSDVNSKAKDLNPSENPSTLSMEEETILDIDMRNQEIEQMKKKIEKMDKYKKENETLREEIECLNMKLMDYNELKRSVEQFKSKQKEITDLKTHQKELKEELDSKRKMNHDLECELEKYKKQVLVLEQLKSQVRDLHQRLQMKQNGTPCCNCNRSLDGKVQDAQGLSYMNPSLTLQLDESKKKLELLENNLQEKDDELKILKKLLDMRSDKLEGIKSGEQEFQGNMDTEINVAEEEEAHHQIRNLIVEQSEKSIALLKDKVAKQSKILLTLEKDVRGEDVNTSEESQPMGSFPRSFLEDYFHILFISLKLKMGQSQSNEKKDGLKKQIIWTIDYEELYREVIEQSIDLSDWNEWLQCKLQLITEQVNTSFI